MLFYDLKYSGSEFQRVGTASESIADKYNGDGTGTLPVSMFSEISWTFSIAVSVEWNCL